MQTYHFDTLNDIDSLVLGERDREAPGDHDVVVKLHAASLNYRDLMVARGLYPGTVTPVVPLSDGVGEVVECGSAVSRWKKHDRVLFSFFQDWISGPLTAEYAASDIGGRVNGVLSELITTHEKSLVRCPDYLSAQQAAGVGCASVTAWSALMKGVPLKAGETVLVQGSGGVSIFALQFAKMMGARIIALTSTDEKARRLRELGSHNVINYLTTPEWDTEVRRLTDGAGVDRVVEVVGPATFERSIKSLAVNGTLALIGVVGGLEGSINPFSLFGPGNSIHSVHVGSRNDFEDSLRAMELASILPVIDKVFPFEEARDAYRYLESQKHIGKVVIAGP